MRSRHETGSRITCRSLLQSIAAAFLLGASTIMGGGCVESAIAAAGATAGFGLAQGQAEAFIRGELKTSYMVPMDKVVPAVIEAMGELQLEVREVREGEYSSYVRGKAEGGREIKVYLKADSPVMTRISIRVGIMGDVAVSRLVMARIAKAMDKPDVTTSPAFEPAIEMY